ncbi:MAG: hypothetical protein ACYTEZ_01615 [Planctomycetota bacterium]|jgi:hypothetical protein
MALRVLSGIVAIGRGPKNGSVTIDFLPHGAAAGGDADLIETTEVGPNAAFADVPAKHVALRQMKLSETTTDAAGGDEWAFIVNDRVDRNSLRITWGGRGLAFAEEISDS